MRIWLLRAGEPVPTDAKNPRLFRTGMLAEMLANKGHDVIWWTSTMNHAQKSQRFPCYTSIKINERLEIKFLHSIIYKRNVSLRRIINHIGIANQFEKLAKREVKPDIIVSCLPTIELSVKAVRFGEKYNIPVIIDVRDLWPEIFLELGPSVCKPLLKIFLYPLFRMTKEVCSKARAITGITEDFVKWGIHLGKRNQTQFDRHFHLAYSQAAPPQEAIWEAEQRWERLGIKKGSNEFVACFFGNFGRQFDLETLIEAARMLQKDPRKIKFVLCGNGDKFDYYKNLAEGSNNIIFPGWVNAADIWTLMRRSSIGLAPYRNSMSFLMSLPNKPVEYMSARLPVISSLKGNLANILEDNECGITYEGAANLIQILKEVYDTPEKHLKLSANAFNFYQEHLTAETVYENMIMYIKEVASSCLFSQ